VLVSLFTANQKRFFRCYQYFPSVRNLYYLDPGAISVSFDDRNPWACCGPPRTVSQHRIGIALPSSFPKNRPRGKPIIIYLDAGLKHAVMPHLLHSPPSPFLSLMHLLRTPCSRPTRPSPPSNILLPLFSQYLPLRPSAGSDTTTLVFFSSLFNLFILPYFPPTLFSTAAPSILSYDVSPYGFI